MPKLTLEERITKTQDAIKKEEAIIAQSRDKLKSLQQEMKALCKQRDQSFAEEIISIVSGGATLTNDQRGELLAMLRTHKLQTAAKTDATESMPISSDSQNAATETMIPNSEFGQYHG